MTVTMPIPRLKNLIQPTCTSDLTTLASALPKLRLQPSKFKMGYVIIKKSRGIWLEVKSFHNTTLQPKTVTEALMVTDG